MARIACLTRAGWVARRVCVCVLAALLLAGGAAAQQIFISPSLSVPTEETFTVAVMVDNPGGDLLMGLDVQIDFDNTIVALAQIAPGAWVTGAGAPFSFFDLTVPGTDMIRFTMAFLGSPVPGGGEAAICHFAALGEGDSPLEFQLLAVRDADNNDLGYGHSTGDLIRVLLAIPVADNTMGGVKALYRR